VTTTEKEIIQYPIVRPDDLTIDPLYRELQKQGPIKVQMPYGEPCWLATRYQDVRTAYTDPRFSKEIGVDRDIPRLDATLRHGGASSIANMDPPRHTRLRRLTLPAFSRSQIHDRRAWVEGLADKLLDRMVEHGKPADFESIYAWKLPLHIITGILGIPEEEVPSYRGWVDDLMSIDTAQDRKLKALGNLTEYIHRLIAVRRERSSDDLLSVMVRARDEGDRLSEDELFSLFLAIFLAGFETTAAQLGSTVYALMTHRHLWQELLDDRTIMPAALEELWRWIPSFRHGMPRIRWAKEDVELSGGVVVPAGEAVLPEHQVANRDESVFPHGWELDFHRVDPAPHLSLAFGAHLCLGAQLAHLEIEVTLEKLLQRFPTLELAIPSDDVEWSSSTFLRTPAALPLTW
jgi:cytochrome P450